MPPTQPGAASNTAASAARHQQIADSNAAANCFLRSRQPAWMTGGAAASTSTSTTTTRRPVSRRSVSGPSSVQPVQLQPQQQQQQQQQQEQNQQKQPLVLPSPAPSDEPSPALSVLLDSPRPAPLLTSDTTNISSSTAPSATNIIPAANAHRIPAPSSTAPSASNSLPVTEARFVYQAPPAESVAPAQPSHAAVQPARYHMEGSPAPVASGNPGPPPPKRRRTDQPVVSQNPCTLMLPIAENYLQALGGYNALEESVARPRFNILLRACREGDEFFLVVHQLFCLWSLYPAEAYSALELSQGIIGSAFATLGDLLKKNDSLSRPLLEWFAQFPVAAGQFGKGLIGGSTVLKQVAEFLYALVYQHAALASKALQRKYPFLVCEQLGILKCYSPTLQFILFNACRRRLGVADNQISLQMEKGFHRDLARHRDPATGLLVERPMEQEAQRLNTLAAFYKSLVDIAAVSSRSPNQPPLRLPSVPGTPVAEHPPVFAARDTLQSAQPTSSVTASPVLTSPVATSPGLPSFFAPPSVSQPRSFSTMASYMDNVRAMLTGTTPQPGPLGVAAARAQQTMQQAQLPPQEPQEFGNGVPLHYAQQVPSQYSAQQLLQLQLDQQRLLQSHQVHQRQQQRFQHELQQFRLRQQQQQQAQLSQAMEQGFNQEQHQRNAQTLAYIAAQLSSPQTPTMAAHPPGAVLLPRLAQAQQQAPSPQALNFQHYPGPMSPSIISPTRVQPPPTPVTRHPPQRTQRGSSQRPRDPMTQDMLLPAPHFQIPPSEWPHDSSDRKSVLMSLHQAHVRSPTRVAKEGEKERLYESVKCLALEPVAVPPKKTMYELRFEVTEEQFALAATRPEHIEAKVPVVEHFDGALRWRVRCCAASRSGETPSESQWVTLYTNWPPYIHMTLNGKALDVRRKTHNGKDLPTDLTDKIERGTNVLRIAIHEAPNDPKASVRHLAVELMHTQRHSAIISSIWKHGVMPAEKTLDTIKRRLTLSSLAGVSEDDIRVEASDLAINLADPFSATIFTVPARGASCTHMECFDLDNWLSTRPAKPTPGKTGGGCLHKHVEYVRVSDHHHPPATWQTLPPVLPAEPVPKPPPTEFPEPPIPVLSKSEKLWNAAYDSLEADDKELVESYVKSLETVLGANSGVAPDTNVLAELHDPTKRQMHMRRLVEEGRAKISRASKITSGVGDVADFVLSVKEIIDVAIRSVPQAALPWAGVCIGLQMLQNPAQATKSNLAGIAHVISSMNWYCALTEHLLNKDNVAAGEDFQTVLCQLENRIVELYKALLQYQMKSVCSYYRNQGLVFLRNMFNLDDWDGDLKLVTDAEAVVQNCAAQFLQEQTKTCLSKLAEHADGMERRLGDIHQDIRDFISLQKDAHRDEMEAACRRDLRVVDPQHDMERIEKNKDELLDDAYNWILRTQEYADFTNWGDSGSGHPPRRLLWIKGHAGTGKTMLMIGLIRQLSHQPVALSPALSFFFCQGTDAALNSATAVLRSLIWLLLLQQPRLISHLLQKYRESGASLFTDKNAFIALSEAFRNMLKDPRLTPVYLAVDALDECRQGRSDLIHLISTSLTLSPNVKWLISSRPEVDLRAALKARDTDSLDAFSSLVELDTQRLEAPVNAYIDHKLATLKREDGYDEDILDQVSREVRQRADNTFLWVALAFKVLETVYGGIEEQHFIEPQDCKTVLVVTSLAFRPLSILELSVLAGLPLGIAEKAVEMCGSFLTITKGTVNLIHQSAKDYLEKNYNRLQSAGPAQAHHEIFRRSMDEISACSDTILLCLLGRPSLLPEQRQL
ncbi:hypothetical protein VTJ49DRAFT_3881 [Mycothermus thermophilus]|uniref:NACHT domain-containing protein n=1 Tax=Humicola insolens TaxID=85995 RepID=A0ABR3VRF4_HUMIN